MDWLHQLLILGVVLAYFVGRFLGYRDGEKVVDKSLEKKDGEIYNCHRKMSDGGIKIS